MRQQALQAGVDLEIDSAGIENWHQGKPPYGPMQEVAHPRGYQMSDLRARQVHPQDFHEFDLIIGMDDQNIADLIALQPGGAKAKIARFTDFAPASGTDHVPDPYYTRDFDGALDLIETCATGLVAHLQR